MRALVYSENAGGGCGSGAARRRAQPEGSLRCGPAGCMCSRGVSWCGSKGRLKLRERGESLQGTTDVGAEGLGARKPAGAGCNARWLSVQREDVMRCGGAWLSVAAQLAAGYTPHVTSLAASVGASKKISLYTFPQNPRLRSEQASPRRHTHNNISTGALCILGRIAPIHIWCRRPCSLLLPMHKICCSSRRTLPSTHAVPASPGTIAAQLPHAVRCSCRHPHSTPPLGGTHQRRTSMSGRSATSCSSSACPPPPGALNCTSSTLRLSLLRAAATTACTPFHCRPVLGRCSA